MYKKKRSYRMPVYSILLRLQYGVIVRVCICSSRHVYSSELIDINMLFHSLLSERHNSVRETKLGQKGQRIYIIVCNTN